MSISMTGYRYEYDNRADKGVYISLSMPWGDSSTISYNGNYGSGSTAAVGISAVSMTQPITS